MKSTVSIKDVKKLMRIAYDLGISIVYSENKMDRRYCEVYKDITIHVDSDLSEIYKDLYEKIEAAGGNPLEDQNKELFGYWKLLNKKGDSKSTGKEGK